MIGSAMIRKLGEGLKNQDTLCQAFIASGSHKDVFIKNAVLCSLQTVITMRILFLISLLGALQSCSPGDKQHQDIVPLQPKEKLRAAFVIVEGVYNSELVAPMDVLQHTVFHTKPGIEVFTVAPDTTVVTTFEGLRIIPDYSFSDTNLPSIDILIVPSAEHSMDSDLKNETLISFVKNKGEAARFVMSLCDGAFVLAQAGLLDNRECTTFPSDIERLRSMFPHLTVHDNVSFVHDGNAITSSGGAKSYDPALYLVELLYGLETAKGIGKGLVIDWSTNKISHKMVKPE
jgi:transcriptional regulator GlxA family with amidase domain